MVNINKVKNAMCMKWNSYKTVRTYENFKNFLLNYFIKLWSEDVWK